jgi:pyridoxal phosphate enzyme (YggS family)
MLEQVKEAYGRIAEKVDTYDGARLIAVSKRQPIERLEVLVDCGHRDFGENYLQEWEGKKDRFSSEIRWHFIGQLQSRKLKTLVDSDIHCIHSLGGSSSLKKLNGLERLPTGGILVQVNLAGEEQKGGFTREALDGLYKDGSLKDCCGLMSIPPANWDDHQLELHYKEMKALNDQFGFSELSMGMSGDWEIALDQGATMVRVGSALFGARPH